MRDELTTQYEQMITEARDAAKGSIKKQSMTAGTIKQGELDGPTKEIGPKGSGPEAADGSKKAEEAPKNINPVDKKKKVKESTTMPQSFHELYNKVILKEVDDLESPEYNDNIGDFPAGEGEIPSIEDGDEMAEGDKFAQAADLFSQLADLFREMSPGTDTEEIPGDETLGGEPEVAPAMGEAVSEPAPKEFKGNIKQFQAPNKLGISGVKTSKGKANTSAGAKKRTGEMGVAPTGVKPGDKSFMKVGGSGPAASGKNASMLED